MDPGELLVGCIFGFIVIAFVLTGVMWVIVHFWPYLLAAAVIGGTAALLRHLDKVRRASEGYQKAKIQEAKQDAIRQIDAAYIDTIEAMRRAQQDRP